MQRQTTTSPQALTAALNRDDTITIQLDASSDLTALKSTVEANASFDFSKNWDILWIGSGEKKYESSSLLMDLVTTIGKVTSRDVTLSLPLKPGDLLKLVRVLLWGQVSKFEVCMCTDKGRTKEDVEKEVLQVLDEICSWKGFGHRRLSLTLPIVLEPKGRFLSTLAEVLPQISLNELRFCLEESPHFDANDPAFAVDMERAIDKIQNGLEKNYSLVQLSIDPLAEMVNEEPSKLSVLMRKLTEEKIWPLLELNERGRGHVLSLPLHLDTWVEIVGRYTNDDHLDAIFYYLRKNTWMFTPEVDLAAQNRHLVKEIDNMKKRQREKDMDSEGLKKRHKAELEAKDQEIRKLQGQLLQAKTTNK